MTITNGYATVPDLIAFTVDGTFSNTQTQIAELAIETASRAIDAHCGRFFYPLPAGTRIFESGFVDDMPSAPSVVAIDADLDGVAETTLTATDYELRPLNQFLPEIGAVPYDEIRLRGVCLGDGRLHVTAPGWGWAAIPTPIKRACLVLSHEMMQDAHNKNGVLGVDGFGVVRLRENPRVVQALRPFRGVRTWGIA